MARVTNPLNIAISGKVGNLVFCNGPSRGSYTRRRPQTTGERSEKQLTTQNKVTLATRFLNPLRQLIGEVWQKDRYTRKTAFGSAFSHMMKYAFSGEYMQEEIVYREVTLSRGVLIKPEGLTAVRNGCHLEISWMPTPVSPATALPEDRAVLVICSETQGMSISFRGSAVRGDERITAELPPVYETDKLHAYLLFVSRNGKYSSDSVYSAC